MRKSTRLIALLMTLLMLIGMMPFATFAVPSTDEEGWIIEEGTGDKFYNDPINGLATGLTSIVEGGVRYYYYFDETTFALKTNYWLELDEYQIQMYFGADGKAANGIVENVVIGGSNNGMMYFVNGRPTAGTVEESGVRYIFGDDGKLVNAIDLTSAEVVIIIKKDGKTNILDFKPAMGAMFIYTVPTYPDYDVEVYDKDLNEVPATGDTVMIVVNAVTSYTEYTVVYSDKEASHDWVLSEEFSTPPTCMDKGLNVYECSVCGKIKRETVDSTGEHVFTPFNDEYCDIQDCNHLKCGGWTKAKDESCTTDGIRYTYCTECNKAINYETITAAHEWDENSSVVIVEPICDEEGLIEYECKHCDATLVEKFRDVDNRYHAGPTNEVIIKAPTCVAKGVAEYTCTSCGGCWTDTLDEDPTNHDWVKDGTIPLEYATCYTGVAKWSYHCVLCGERKEDTEPVPESEWIHDWRDYYNHDDTKHWNECNVCGTKRDEAEHTMDIWENDPVATGTHTNSCACGYKITGLAHAYEVDGDGNKVFYNDEDNHWNKCSVCGTKLDEEVHAYDDEKDGEYHWKECECGKVIDRVAHDYNIPKYDDNDHWNECSCGEVIDKVAHDYNIPEYDDNDHWNECECGAFDQKIPHTFTQEYDETNHWNECACGKTVNVTPHNYATDGNGDRIYSNNGEYHWYDCTDCEYDDGKTAHNVTAIMEAKEPTCTERGNSAGSWCADCEFVLVDVEYYGILSHEPINVMLSDADGHYYACRNCTSKIGFDGHVFETEWTSNDKEHKRVCIVCNARDPESGAHDYLGEDYYTNIDDEEGTATTSCKDCGHETQVEIETWYEKLGMIKVDGKYYYPVEGVNVTNKFVEFVDGLRFFGEDGALVLTAGGVTDDALTFVTEYITFQNARGVIDDAVITLAEGTYCVKQSVIQKSKLVAVGTRYYYFDENGLMVKDKLVDIDGDETYDYYFDKDGVGYTLNIAEAQ